jgi:predicted ATPase/DNA-binding CsgD family transcriptional regulator
VPGNLPAELTSFVGRRNQLSEIRRLMGSARLVTLTGPGGVGKTRLALQAAHGLARTFKDGVWFVDLAPLSDPDLVAAAVCQVLNLRDQSARWTLGNLADYLADRKVLLVLDNCEHLIDACASLAEALLRAAPELRIIATSRQALDLIGEAVVRVPPLTLPAECTQVRVTMVDQYEALQLFLDRAAMARPDFVIDDTNVAMVAEICGRLDGIPLAIELVTARLRSMTLEHILSGLHDRYRLLAGGSRTTITRQRTLRALVEWSYELCSPEEQALWRRMSVFSGSFGLDAARFVCSGTQAAGDDIPELVTGLVEKSILLLEQDVIPRYRLLDTIRDYGAERLQAVTETGELRRRHRDYYKHLIETAEREWLTELQVTWLNRLRTEHANIRAALQYCFEAGGETSIGVEMAARLWAFWIAAGVLAEGRLWLEKGLRQETSRATAARARALWVVSYITACQGDLDAAQQWLREGRDVATVAGDARAGAYLTLSSGLIAMFRGDTDEANLLLAQAMRRHRELGETTGLMDAQFLLGSLASVSGEVDQALDLVRGTLARCEEFGERWWRAWTRRNLAVALWRAGDRPGSGEVVIQALRDCIELNEQLCGALCLEVCAWSSAARRDYRRAAVLFGATQAVWEALSATPFWQLPDEDARWEQFTRNALGDTVFEQAFQEGLQMTVKEAIDYGLGSPVPSQAAILDGGRGPAASLTPREFEVARYVADGFSNQQIASRLTISRRTAETHVEHILAKLGFTSRAQIAAWFAEHHPAAHGGRAVSR